MVTTMEKNEKCEYLKKQFIELEDDYSSRLKACKRKLNEFDDITSSIIKTQDILSDLANGLIGEESDRMIRETNSVFEELSYSIKKDYGQIENAIEDLEYELKVRK